jgi:hypothetical protein
MRILFDKSAPYGLVRYLEGHSVFTAEECGWDRLTNGDLLAAVAGSRSISASYGRQESALSAEFIWPQDCFVVLGNSPWPVVRVHIAEIVAAVNAATTGSFVEVEIPLPPRKPFTRL